MHRPVATPGATAPTPRRFGVVNWRGVYTLYRRETIRYFRYAGETLAGPATSALLFLAIFHLALGGEEARPGVSLSAYIGPGIVMFMIAHAAFEASAFPLLFHKMERMISDVIGAPLTPLEILAGYALPAIGNALTTGAVVLALVAVFVDLPVHSVAAIVGFAVAGAVVLALLGVIVAIAVERWDGFSAVDTFLVAPLGFLSGAFFPIDTLPQEVRWVFHLNPVFQAVEGFRYGFIGQAQTSLFTAALVLAGLSLVLGGIAWRMLATGYRIKP
jgi:ABC-2 type transport system permease protein